MTARLFYFAVILVSLHGIASAQVFKCKTANGGYVFQGTVCDEDADALSKKQSASVAKNPNAGFKRKDDGPGANWDVNRSTAPVDRRFYEPLRAPAPAVVATSQPTDAGRMPRQSAAAKQIEQSQSKANAEAEAFNKHQRCETAKQQVDVYRTARPVYTLDNKADRHYVEDAERAAKLATWQRAMAESCN